MQELRIVFMGTPEFAVPSLKVLIENNYNVVGVVTAPDKPKGRGQKLSGSPVKNYSIDANIPVLQPLNLKSPGFLNELGALNANLQIVVAFRMLPEVAWSMPEFGTFNLHASLLPQYRGAAPINWAIINGETITGVTTFFLQQEIDTGSIILQEEEVILENDDAGSLYERLMLKGADLVLKSVGKIRERSFESKPQDAMGSLKTAPKIFKQNCSIDWSKTSKQVYDQIRGLSPYPGAWTKFDEKTYKIFKTQIIENQLGHTPGTLHQNEKGLTVSTGNGMLQLLEIQQEGKRRMSVVDFLKGNQIITQ